MTDGQPLDAMEAPTVARSDIIAEPHGGRGDDEIVGTHRSPLSPEIGRQRGVGASNLQIERDDGQHREPSIDESLRDRASHTPDPMHPMQHLGDGNRRDPKIVVRP